MDPAHRKPLVVWNLHVYIFSISSLVAVVPAAVRRDQLKKKGHTTGIGGAP